MARRRTTEVPSIEVREFTRAGIDRGIAKLRRRIDDVTKLDPRQVRFDDAKIENVAESIRETIREVFGTNSPEFKDHGHHPICTPANNHPNSQSHPHANF